MHCVASTCSTSLVPMPNASEPNAPCVEVCESPQTIVIPGCVTPSSGPMTWTIPCAPEPTRRRDAELRAVALERFDLRRESSSLIRAATGVPSVGML